MKEYGGYLPFEIFDGKDYFEQNNYLITLKCNSAKTAIYMALKELHITEIGVPKYLCSSVISMLEESGYKIKFYDINESLLPNEFPATEAILLVNYFGLVGMKVKEIAERYAKVIIDNSHAFYEEPLIRDGVMNVYSNRKFFGVPDGGYLVANQLVCNDLEREVVSENIGYLFKSLEYGTNYAYHEKKQSDLYFQGRYLGMSIITESIMKKINYVKIANVRVENCKIMHEKLGQYNKFSVNPVLFVPYLYPLYCENGAKIKKQLINHKIWTPTLWKEYIDLGNTDTVEYNISNDTVFLPIDQRYKKEDILYISDLVVQIINDIDK